MRFSEDLLKILAWAADEAQRTGWHNIQTDHLMLALIRFGRGEAFEALKSGGIDPYELKERIDSAIFRKDSVPYCENAEIRPDDKVRSCLNLAVFETSLHRGTTTTVGDLLVAVARTNGSISAQYLEENGMSPAKLRKLLQHDETADGSDGEQADHSAQMAIAMAAELTRIFSASDVAGTNAALPNS